MVKILDLFDALRLADRGELPLPRGVLESKKDVNGIFATLHPDVTPGSACGSEDDSIYPKVFDQEDVASARIRLSIQGPVTVC